MEVPTYSVPVETSSYSEPEKPEPEDRLKEAQAAYREIRSTKWNSSPETMFDFLDKLRDYIEATHIQDKSYK